MAPAGKDQETIEGEIFPFRGGYDILSVKQMFWEVGKRSPGIRKAPGRKGAVKVAFWEEDLQEQQSFFMGGEKESSAPLASRLRPDVYKRQILGYIHIFSPDPINGSLIIPAFQFLIIKLPNSK